MITPAEAEYRLRLPEGTVKRVTRCRCYCCEKYAYQFYAHLNDGRRVNFSWKGQKYA